MCRDFSVLCALNMLIRQSGVELRGINVKYVVVVIHFVPFRSPMFLFSHVSIVHICIYIYIERESGLFLFTM